jgi:hypothetical protein
LLRALLSTNQSFIVRVLQATPASSKPRLRPETPKLTFTFSSAYSWIPACNIDWRAAPEETVETMLQVLVIVGGLTFSLATSLLIEELIFGQIVRVAFARHPEPAKRVSANERNG